MRNMQTFAIPTINVFLLYLFTTFALIIAAVYMGISK